MATSITAKTPGQIINELPPGPFKTLTKINPTGSLQARKQINGTVSLFWRYSIGTTSDRVPLGVYDSSASPKSLQPTTKGYSIAAATAAAQLLAQAHHENRAMGGRPALVAAEVEAKQAAAEVTRKAAAAKLEAAQFTLKALLNHYCDHLEKLGRSSHKKARAMFRLHVVEAWPAVATMPANKVTGEQFADIMRRVVEAGHGRTSNKLRAYAHAAYKVALSVRSKASVPVHFKGYNVTHNPVSDTEADASFNKADKNPLSADEMRTYWKLIEKAPGPVGAALRLHLLTGGQRIEQFVQLLTENANGETIMLWDGKGRPGPGARQINLPLIPPAAAALAKCEGAGGYVMAARGGRSHVAASTFSSWANRAVGDAIPSFNTKRIRSGVETMLASAGVSEDIRGRLQSHGISGVQNRHYDGYDYMPEKRKALETLYKLLNKKT